MKESLANDKKRYSNGKVPIFQIYFRKYNETSNFLLKKIYKIIFVYFRNKQKIELSIDTKIDHGLYIGHPFGITINPNVVIGKNCNIHKGVTIGQENRGVRKGTPIIGNQVWIGINATIVGKIVIGDDVLIAPNSYVNCDVPDHSIVIGNPCIIIHKENATKDYIDRRV